MEFCHLFEEGSECSRCNGQNPALIVSGFWVRVRVCYKESVVVHQ